jgi:hypothetical protein
MSSTHRHGPGDGCQFCGGFPTSLHQRCHPSAPLRAVVTAPGVLELRCYVPECDRLVITLAIETSKPKH